MKKVGWKYCKLGDVCLTINGLWKGKKEPFIRVGVLRNANFTKDFTLDYSKTEYLDVEVRQYEKRKLEKGDLIVEKSGGSDKQPVGRTVLFEAENGEYSFSNFTSVLRIKNKNLFISKYLYYNILHIYWRGDTKTMQKATTGIHNLDFDRFLDLQILVCSYNDQQQIVEYLDTTFEKIDRIKEKAEKKIEDAKGLFQAALNEKLKMREGWKEKTIGEIQTDMYRGSGIKRDQVTTDGFPCIRYGEIYTAYNFCFCECLSHTDESIIKPRKYFEKGDILFAITGESVEEIGKCIAYTGDEKCLLGGDIVAMKHNQNPQFLAYALSTDNAISQKGLGKTKLKVVHTNIPSLKNIVIPLPPTLTTQQQIVTDLDALNEKTNAIEHSCRQIISECDNLKQAILKQVFE